MSLTIKSYKFHHPTLLSRFKHKLHFYLLQIVADKITTNSFRKDRISEMTTYSEVIILKEARLPFFFFFKISPEKVTNQFPPLWSTIKDWDTFNVKNHRILNLVISSYEDLNKFCHILKKFFQYWFCDIYLVQPFDTKYICAPNTFLLMLHWASTYVIWSNSWKIQYRLLLDTRIKQQFSIIQFSHSVASDSLWPKDCSPLGFLVYISPTPGACSNSCPSSRWYHPTISSSVIPFAS